MYLLVRNLSGHCFVVEASQSDPIARIMAEIERRERVPPEQQFLTFGDHPLSADHSIGQSGLQSGSCVDLSLRLLGGGSYDRTDPKLVQLAKSYRWEVLICRKCYVRLPITAKNCRKCGSADLRKRYTNLSKPL